MEIKIENRIMHTTRLVSTYHNKRGFIFQYKKQVHVLLFLFVASKQQDKR
jgi:hypothetical protein